MSRRKFLVQSSLAAGAGSVLIPGIGMETSGQKLLPREVWIGTVSLMNLSAPDSASMVNQVITVMQKMLPYQPDLICLPETFASNNVDTPVQLQEAAEEVPGKVVTALAGFARENKCYVICPVYSRDGKSIYNAAVLIDRAGKVMGEYRKTHPASYEINSGIRPGPLDPPVFDTDFGRIGIQICYDIKWNDGWSRLKEKGAEIIFWPSAYSGGKEICSKAWQHQVYVVSSTRKDTTRIVDMSGQVIAHTGRWEPEFAVAPLNLEKIFIQTWPAVEHFPDILQKYNSKVRISTFDEEEWSILESLDPGVRVVDILHEYGIRSNSETIQDVTRMQEDKR